MRPGSQDPRSRGLFLPHRAGVGAMSPDPHSIGIKTFNDLLKITRPVGSVSQTTGSGTGQSQEFMWRTQRWASVHSSAEWKRQACHRTEVRAQRRPGERASTAQVSRHDQRGKGGPARHASDMGAKGYRACRGSSRLWRRSQ